MIDKRARHYLLKKAEELELASPVTTTVVPNKLNFDWDKIKTILDLGKFEIAADYWSGPHGTKGVKALFRF